MDTKSAVKEKYGSVASAVSNSQSTACCSPGLNCCDPITKNLYGEAEKGALPEKAVLASLGCGNPTALIELKEAADVLVHSVGAQATPNAASGATQHIEAH